MKWDPPTESLTPASDEDGKRAASVANYAAMTISMVGFAFSRLQDAVGWRWQRWTRGNGQRGG